MQANIEVLLKYHQSLVGNQQCLDPIRLIEFQKFWTGEILYNALPRMILGHLAPPSSLVRLPMDNGKKRAEPLIPWLHNRQSRRADGIYLTHHRRYAQIF